MIIHVSINELDSERQADMIAKSTIYVAKGTGKNTRTVSISGIVPRNDIFNKKALDVNDELAKMCRKALNKIRLHLNRNRSDKIGKNFVSFIFKYYKSGT